MLSATQRVYFQTFGFVILRHMFSPTELLTIDDEFEDAITAAYRHAPFDGTKRYNVQMMGPGTPFFTSLLEDPRFCGAAEQLYGADVLGISCDANRYVGDSYWHPDTYSLDQYGVKFAFYLEPVGEQTGALRVVPGSHKDPLHNELRAALKPEAFGIGDVPAYACRSEPGDVVAFDTRLWHASLGGAVNRRMCTLVYFNNPKTPAEDQATRRTARVDPNHLATYNRPGAPLYDPDWLANAGGSPRRQRWLDRMRELEFFDYQKAGG